jgi:hypothetical protein
VNFYNEAAWHAYEKKRETSGREYRKRQAEQEISALLKRVPEHLGRDYCIVRACDGRVFFKSDHVSCLAASMCTAEVQIRQAIDTSQPFRIGSTMCQGGGELYWVVLADKVKERREALEGLEDLEGEGGDEP